MLTLYSLDVSPPCRAVLMTGRILGLEMNIIEVALAKGEARSPGYLKMNPQHTVPTLDDNGFFIAESRAIMQYIVDAYGKDDGLYPKDAKVRGTINSRLFFDASTLYSRVYNTFLLPLFTSAEFGDPGPLRDALTVLDALIGEKDVFIVNNQLTIADIAIAVTVATIEAVEVEIDEFKNITRWYKNVKARIPNFADINEKGDAFIGQHYRTKLAKSKFY